MPWARDRWPSSGPCARLARMFPAFALVIALNLLQPAGTPPARPAPPPVSEATPVAVPQATPTALRYYTSGNRLWVLDQVVSIVLLAIILFSGMSARLREWAQRIGRNWFFTIVVYFALRACYRW
jgi:STE24 endopeptidase